MTSDDLQGSSNIGSHDLVKVVQLTIRNQHKTSHKQWHRDPQYEFSWIQPICERFWVREGPEHSESQLAHSSALNSVLLVPQFSTT